jgi:four helix bundle protein
LVFDGSNWQFAIRNWRCGVERDVLALTVRISGGMGVYRFEDLRVWQAARDQCDRVGMLIKRPELRCDAYLANQMNAASLSVMLNISEGFLRRRDKEMLQFLRISAGSHGELRSCYYAAHGREYIDDAELAGLLELNASIGRMTRRFQASLDPPAPGTKDQGRTKDRGRTKDQGPGTDQGPRARSSDMGNTSVQRHG